MKLNKTSQLQFVTWKWLHKVLRWMVEMLGPTSVSYSNYSVWWKKQDGPNYMRNSQILTVKLKLVQMWIANDNIVVGANWRKEHRSIGRIFEIWDKFWCNFPEYSHKIYLGIQSYWHACAKYQDYYAIFMMFTTEKHVTIVR